MFVSDKKFEIIKIFTAKCAEIVSLKHFLFYHEALNVQHSFKKILKSTITSFPDHQCMTTSFKRCWSLFLQTSNPFPQTFQKPISQSNWNINLSHIVRFAFPRNPLLVKCYFFSAFTPTFHCQRFRSRKVLRNKAFRGFYFSRSERIWMFNAFFLLKAS